MKCYITATAISDSYEDKMNTKEGSNEVHKNVVQMLITIIPKRMKSRIHGSYRDILHRILLWEYDVVILFLFIMIWNLNKKIVQIT